MDENLRTSSSNDSNNATKLINSAKKDTVPFYPKSMKPGGVLKMDGMIPEIQSVLSKYSNESCAPNMMALHLNEKTIELDDILQSQSNIYNLKPSLTQNFNKMECFIINDDNISKGNKSKTKNMYNPSDKLSSNYYDMSDGELVKYCHIISKEQAGCRFLQKKIEENPELVNNLIFYEIFDYSISLMYDCFANYFVQKVIEHLTQDKLEQVINLVKFSLMFIDLN